MSVPAEIQAVQRRDEGEGVAVDRRQLAVYQADGERPRGVHVKEEPFRQGGRGAVARVVVHVQHLQVRQLGKAGAQLNVSRQPVDPQRPQGP